MVANSTQIGPLRNAKGLVIAGAVTMSNSTTTMSCHNVSGFAAGEVLKLKSVSNTGFSVEYMKFGSSGEYVIIEARINKLNSDNKIPQSSINLFFIKLLIFVKI